MPAWVAKILAWLNKAFKALAAAFGWLGKILAQGWRGIKRLWGWIKLPFRHIRSYYEPWMLSSILLLGAGGLILAFWIYNWRPRYDDPRVLGLPVVLGFMALMIAGLISYAFLYPNARNPFTAQLYLRRLYRPWMLSVVSLLAIGAMIYGFWRLNASNPAAPKRAEKQPDQSVSLRFENVELRGRKQGTPFFTILAEKVEVSKNNELVTFLKGKTKPHGEFYNLKDWEEDASGALPKRRAITWEANKAVFNTTDQNLSMLGEVKIRTDAGDTITTEEMLWNRNEQTLTSNTRTKVHTHQDTYLQSNKLKVETRTKALFLEGQVFIDMKLDQEKVVDVEKFEQ